MIVAGVGYLIANDALTDCAFMLIEPSVNEAVPAGGIENGLQTVNLWDRGMYVGAMILVGVLGGNLEIVTITAVTEGVSFQGQFVNNHLPGEPIVGATFPTRQTTDPFFTQAEMLGYLSQAANDFLTECPIAVAVSTTVVVPPAAQNAALPADCMTPQRVATAAYPLRETSQSNLDAMDYRWQQQAASQPYAYFRDKVGLQKLGIFPRANNNVPLEIVYAQRGPVSMGLADGFNFPDVFVPIVKARVLSFAYSKDGEQRNPGLAKFWDQRFIMGCKAASMFLQAMEDPNVEMSQQ